MKKLLLTLLLVPTLIKPANYGLSKGRSMFAPWPAANGYDSQIKKEPYQKTNPPISRAPSKIWGKIQAPIPTNRWFSTLAISGDITYTSDTTPAEFTQPFSVITFPYIIQPLINGKNAQNEPTYPGLMISVPEKQYITTVCNPDKTNTAVTSYMCQNNTCQAGVDQKPIDACYPFSASYISLENQNIILSCTESLAEQDAFQDPVINSDVKKNPFGVTLLFRSSTDNPTTNKLQRFTTPIVRGMPFVTAEFTNTTPSLQFPGQAVLRFATIENGQTLSPQPNGLPPTTLTGNSFIVQLNSGQSWFIYTQEQVTLNYIKSPNSETPDQIVASQALSGLVQVISVTIPQIQAPAIPMPLPEKPQPGVPYWKTLYPQFTTYEEYFEQMFFPAVQSWYATTYMGTEYQYEMPAFKVPQGSSVYKYYTTTYYNQLNTDWQSQTGPKGQKNLNNFILTTLNTFEAYSGIYPTGGTVELTAQENNPTLTINWTTNIPATVNKNLLMLTLPHHQELLPQTPNLWDEAVHYDSIRGQLLGFLGTTWTLQYQNPGVGWYCKNDANIRNPEFQKIINNYLDQEDLSVQATDSYGFGKEVARLARLALIGHQTNYVKLNDILLAIKNALNSWIPQGGSSLGKNANPLYYDSQWGGLCTQNGLESHDQDYGMGWYNDHHFHFGYFIYAAAVYLHLTAEHQEQDSKFAPLLIKFTKELIRDIANPNNDDRYFPEFRLMDWYLGHSLAAGIFPFGSGKNQESTSEAVNAWYAISLFGKALEAYKNHEEESNSLQNLGNTLMAAEILSAQTYWYMMPEISATQPSINSEIYPPIFNQLACVGVLWETKADYATFFGTNVEYINLIHFLPFTPATEALIPPAWNAYQWEGPESIDPTYQQMGLKLGLKSSLTRTIDPITGKTDPLQNQWRSYVHMSQAISNPAEAQKALDSFIANINKKFQPFDNGNSATNTLYWFLTRPNFTPTGTIPQYVPSTTPTPTPAPTPTPPTPTPAPTPNPTPTPAPTPTPKPKPTPAPKPTPTPSQPSTPIPAPGKLVPGLPASPSIAESIGYSDATKSIAAYLDYLKTNYLQGVINWWIQTYPSKFPKNISLSFSGATPQDVYNNFANSAFYQTLVKHYNKHKKAYFHIPALPAGKTRPPLPSITSNINNFIQQTFIPTWYEPNMGTYKGYTSVPSDSNADQYYEFLINIYAPVYLKWIQTLQKA